MDLLHVSGSESVALRLQPLYQRVWDDSVAELSICAFPSIKGELYLDPKLGMFCEVSQNYQYHFEK